MNAQTLAYAVLLGVGFISTRYCSLKNGTFSGIDSFDIFMEKMAGVILDNKENRTTETFWLNVLLCVVPWTTFICRSTPDSIGKRLGWQYFGSFLAIAFGFPCQLICGQPQTPALDTSVSWMMMVLVWGLGLVITWYITDPVIVVVWLLLIWPIVPSLYERITAMGAMGSNKVLGLACVILSAAGWTRVFINPIESPFVNWMGCFFFFDYVVFTLTAAAWAFEQTGKSQIVALTLFFPAAGMFFTFDEMDNKGSEQAEAELIS